MPYDELVKSLRDKAEFLDRTSYGRNVHNPFAVTMKQAADAIEELNKRNCELLFQVCQAEALIDYYQTGRMVSNEPPKEA